MSGRLLAVSVVYVSLIWIIWNYHWLCYDLLMIMQMLHTIIQTFNSKKIYSNYCSTIQCNEQTKPNSPICPVDFSRCNSYKRNTKPYLQKTHIPFIPVHPYYPTGVKTDCFWSTESTIIGTFPLPIPSSRLWWIHCRYTLCIQVKLGSTHLLPSRDQVSDDVIVVYIL